MLKASLLIHAIAAISAVEHMPGASLFTQTKRQPRIFTDADAERVAKAVAKRERKAERNRLALARQGKRHDR